MLRHTYPAPDPNVLFYRRERENGLTEVAKVQAITNHSETNWRCTFLVPGHAPYTMDQYTSELDSWEAVYAVTEADISSLVERVAQRVVELLQVQGASPVEIVETATQVAESKTVEEAILSGVLEEESPQEDPPDVLDIFDAPHHPGQKEEVQEEVSVASVPHVCLDCGKIYKYKKSYDKHRLTHELPE